MTAAPDELTIAKRAMRAQVLSKLRLVRPADRAQQSAHLTARLLEDELFEDVRTLMAYCPLPEEPDLAPLERACAHRGIRLAVPEVDWDQIRLTPRAVPSLSCCAPGRLGILQPPEGSPAVDPEEIDLVVVPGVAFDRRGARLGRGKGFYDRFLADLGARAVALALREQIVDRVPTGAQDRSMDAVFTPDGVFLNGDGA